MQTSIQNRTRHCAALLAALLIAACGQSAQEPTAQAQAAAVAAGVPAEALTAKPPSGINGEPVDTCAMLDDSEARAAAGKLYKEPEAQAAQGSLLGQCEYFGDKLVLMVNAYPANGYQATIKYHSRESGSRPVSGLAGEAALTPVGLMIQPPGKPFFVVVYTIADGKFDETAALAIGRKLKL